MVKFIVSIETHICIMSWTLASWLGDAMKYFSKQNYKLGAEYTAISLVIDIIIFIIVSYLWTRTVKRDYNVQDTFYVIIKSNRIYVIIFCTAIITGILTI